MKIRKKYFRFELSKYVFLIAIGKDGYPLFYIWYMPKDGICKRFLRVKFFNWKRTIIKQYEGQK